MDDDFNKAEQQERDYMSGIYGNEGEIRGGDMEREEELEYEIFKAVRDAVRYGFSQKKVMQIVMDTLYE